MKPNRFVRFMMWLFDKIPPRGVQVEYFLCRKCGKIRLFGEMFGDLWRANCPKCGSREVVAPKEPRGWRFVKLLWLLIFHRKLALYGLKEGLHNNYRGGKMPESPEEQKAKLKPVDGFAALHQEDGDA